MNMTIDQVARALDITAATLQRWVRQGRIPIRMRQGQVLFHQADLEKWADAHHMHFVRPDEQRPSVAQQPNDGLAAALSRGGVLTLSASPDPTDLFKRIVDQIPGLEDDQRVELVDKLIEREQMASTGVGKGIAIPHPRGPLTRPPAQSIISTCFLDDPVDFKALDDRPVDVLFVLISPAVSAHLAMLSKLAFCLRAPETHTFLQSRPSAQALLDHFSDCERRLDGDTKP